MQGEKFLKAHGIVLSMTSEWFKQALTKPSPQISINEFTEVEEEVFQEILAYLYTGVVHITYALVGEIAKLAHFLRLEWLYQQCISVIRQK